jgi:hypothetical protein
MAPQPRGRIRKGVAAPVTDGPVPTGVRRRRRAELEWLRVLAMGVVFVAHVCMVFSPWQDFHVQSDARSRLLGTVTVLAWPWVMPLFMTLAGSAAWFGLQRRSTGRYLGERVLRVFIPLVVGSAVVAPPQIYLRRLTRGEFDGSFFEFLPRFFLDGPYPEGNLTATHLWFLAYLFTYAVVALPLFVWLRGRGTTALRSLQRLLSTGPGLLATLLVPILVTQIGLRGAYPQHNGFFHDWANHAWLGSAFVAGFLLVSSEGPRDAVRALWRPSGIVAVVASLGMAGMLLARASAWSDALDPATASQALLPPPYSGLYVFWWALFSVATCTWILFVYGAADRHLRDWHPFLEWASPLVYPFYVFHQMVIVVAAVWITRFPGGWAVEAPALGVVALAGTLALCEATRRWAPTRRLFGVRSDPIRTPRRREVLRR